MARLPHHLHPVTSHQLDSTCHHSRASHLIRGRCRLLLGGGIRGARRLCRLLRNLGLIRGVLRLLLHCSSNNNNSGKRFRDRCQLLRRVLLGRRRGTLLLSSSNNSHRRNGRHHRHLQVYHRRVPRPVIKPPTHPTQSLNNSQKYLWVVFHLHTIPSHHHLQPTPAHQRTTPNPTLKAHPAQPPLRQRSPPNSSQPQHPPPPPNHPQ